MRCISSNPDCPLRVIVIVLLVNVISVDCTEISATLRLKRQVKDPARVRYLTLFDMCRIIFHEFLDCSNIKLLLNILKLQWHPSLVSLI